MTKNSNQLSCAQLVRLPKFAEVTGCSRDALYEYIKKVDLRQYVHWYKKKGRYWIDTKEFDKWVRDGDE